MTVTLYGIANCDTVKRARAWLAGQGIAAAFHDFRKAGVPAAQLDAWLDALGWELLLNRRGTAWRALPDDLKRGVDGRDAARRVMLEHPSTIKRPVVDWGGGRLSVGFDPQRWPL